MQWRGLVFAAIDPRMDFAAWTQGPTSRLRAPVRYAFRRRVAYEVACNWKVYVDNYLEGLPPAARASRPQSPARLRCATAPERQVSLQVESG